MDPSAKRKMAIVDELIQLVDASAAESPEDMSPGGPESGEERPAGALVVEIGSEGAEKPGIGEKMCPHCGKTM